MGLREKLNDNPRTSIALAVGAGVVVIGVTVNTLVNLAKRQSPAVQQVEWRSAVYYCDEDGKDPFGDVDGRPTPFEHNGKPAYRAFVYSCGEQGRMWVQCVEKRDSSGNVFVKKPGTTEWIPDSDPRAAVIRNPVCPDGRKPVAHSPPMT